MLGPLLAALVSPILESGVNKAIISVARDLMATMGMRPTPTAVFSARMLTITPSGMNLQLVLADLLGPAIVSGTLVVAVAPTPAASVQRTYTVTVTNSVSGNPVAGATLILRNFGATGISTTTTATTDAMGQARFTVTLRANVTVARTVETDMEGVLREVEGERHVTNPSVTASAPGFGSVTKTLL
jgi:hypothetical protein